MPLDWALLDTPNARAVRPALPLPQRLGTPDLLGFVPGGGIGLNKVVIYDDRISSVYSLGTRRGGPPPLAADFHLRVLNTHQKSMFPHALHAPQAMPFPAYTPIYIFLLFILPFQQTITNSQKQEIQKARKSRM